MSEQQTNYVTETEEAMELLQGSSVEIHPPTTTLVRERGQFKEVENPAFIKVSTAFKNELCNFTGDALKTWFFICLSINRNTGRANPGLRTIAKKVGLSVNTVQKNIKEMENCGLLTVIRDEKRYNIYEINEYVSANRADPSVSKFDTPVSNGDESVSNSAQSVSPSVIHNQRNQSQPDLVDGILNYTLKPKAIRDALAKYFQLTPNFETKYNRQWMQWAIENNVTEAQIERAADLYRRDKRFNWRQPELKIIQEHWIALTEETSSSEADSPAYQPYVAPPENPNAMSYEEWMKSKETK